MMGNINRYVNYPKRIEETLKQYMCQWFLRPPSIVTLCWSERNSAWSRGRYSRAVARVSCLWRGRSKIRILRGMPCLCGMHGLRGVHGIPNGGSGRRVAPYAGPVHPCSGSARSTHTIRCTGPRIRSRRRQCLPICICRDRDSGMFGFGNIRFKTCYESLKSGDLAA